MSIGLPRQKTRHDPPLRPTGRRHDSRHRHRRFRQHLAADQDRRKRTATRRPGRLRRPEGAARQQAGLGHFKKHGSTPKRLVRNSASPADAALRKPTPRRRPFTAGQWVDVIGTTKGKGFQGAVKRHNFGGLRMTHGSMMHRRTGAIGCRSTPGRVWKNQKMPGHMGTVRRTTQNLKVVAVRPEDGVILIRCRPRLQGRYVSHPPGQEKDRRQVNPRSEPHRHASMSAKSSPPKTPAPTHRLVGPTGAARPSTISSPPARQPPHRHRLHQDPRRGQRQQQEDLPPERHRQRPPRRQARPDLRRRRRGLRPRPRDYSKKVPRTSAARPAPRPQRPRPRRRSSW
jgi:50S ribosomal protein uL3